MLRSSSAVRLVRAGLLLQLAGCAARIERPPAPSPRPAVWVDSRGGGGDGSREHPFRSLAEALRARPEGGEVHLAEGVYPGPFVAPHGVRLAGRGRVVLTAEGHAPVVRALGDLELEGVDLQGGAWGLEAARDVMLRDVGFSGQREGGLRMTAGQLRVERGRWRASVSETSGVLLEGPVEAHLERSSFEGPFRRGVETRGEVRATLDRVTFRDAVTALHQEGGAVSVRASAVSGGRGPGLFVARGRLELANVRVVGHEYGLQSSGGAELAVKGFTSLRAERAGLGLVASKGRLEEVVVQESGSFGAVQLVQSELQLLRFRLEGSTAAGLTVLGGKLVAEEGAILDTRLHGQAEGDGLQLRRADVTLRAVSVTRAAGVGLVAAEGARVKARGMSLSRCREGGVVVDTRATFEVVGLEVVDSLGPPLVVPGEGLLTADAVTARRFGPVLLWAECLAGARVRLSRLVSDVLQGLESRCVEWRR